MVAEHVAIAKDLLRGSQSTNLGIPLCCLTRVHGLVWEEMLSESGGDQELALSAGKSSSLTLWKQL